MPSIKEFIQDKRPSLSASSVTTYASILRSLYKKVFGDGEINFDKFDDHESILDHLKDLPPNKRKTILSALVVVTNNANYREQMVDDVRDYQHEISKQEMTDSQKNNWVTQDEIASLFNSLKRSANEIYKKSSLTNNDLQVLQNFIIIALFHLIAPRRSKDYVDFKIKNIDKEKDNYMDKGKFVFNSYKTAKTYGRQEVAIPKTLTTIINKWMKVNPTDYLLFDSNLNPLTSVKLNQRLNRIFDGKKVAVNILRHSFLTNKFGDTINQKKQIENTMQDMGSSANVLVNYVKQT
jgi:hypothetical protein